MTHTFFYLGVCCIQCPGSAGIFKSSLRFVQPQVDGTPVGPDNMVAGRVTQGQGVSLQSLWVLFAYEGDVASALLLCCCTFIRLFWIRDTNLQMFAFTPTFVLDCTSF